MPMKKLRDFLAQANPPMDFRRADTPHFTDYRTESWPVVPSWSEWSDLSRDTIEKIMGPLLDEEFDLPEELPDGPEALLVTDNEPMFQFEIIRHNNIIVNAATHIVSQSYPDLVTMCWASGQSALGNKNKGFPDFSIIPLKPRASLEGRTDCICPGDTKYYDTKEATFPESFMQQAGDEEHWAQKCLRQLCHYSVKRKTRYFYLLTPEGAIIGRRGSGTTAKIVRPEIIKIPWDAPEGELNVNPALLFTFIISGLDHEVKGTYHLLEQEYDPLFRLYGPSAPSE